MKGRELEIKFRYFVLLENHEKRCLSLRHEKRVHKLGPKFVGPFRVLEEANNDSNIDVEGERTKVNLDPVRVYKVRNDNVSSRMLSGESHFHGRAVFLLILLFRLSICLATFLFFKKF